MTELTVKTVLYVASKEGMVQEMYYDNANPPRKTWALGVTDESGHLVGRYKDNPQTLQKCCDVSIWLMKNSYLKDVLKAFGTHQLTEAQLAAILSWHWNTGRILNTDLVGLIKTGKLKEAEKFWRTKYTNGGVLQSRRDSEANLFFKGVWPSSLLVPIYPVNKPSYTPAWGKAKLVDLTKEITEALAK